MLVMTAVQSAALTKWAGQFAGSADKVEFAEFDGYGRLMCDPTANTIAISVIERCADWIRDHAGEGRAASPVAAPHMKSRLFTMVVHLLFHEPGQ